MRAVAGDITDAAHRRALVGAAAELGGLDLLVNNAGTLGASPLPSLADYPLDELRVAARGQRRGTARRDPGRPPAPAGRRPDPACSTSPRTPPSRPTRAGAATAPGRRRSSTSAPCWPSSIPTVSVWSVDPGDLRTAMHQEAYPG